MAYLDVGLNFRYIFRFKNAPEPQNGGNFENFEKQQKMTENDWNWEKNRM